jgi:hypothetical protein
MKKISFLLILSILVILTNCGPSQKEINEKRINDSIRIADSLHKADSIAAILNFKIGFISIEKYLLSNSTPEIVEKAISAKYSLVNKHEEEWTFRDDSKSWEATINVIFDGGTRIVKEIQFTSPESRVYDYMDELRNVMGFHHVGSEECITGGMMDIYANNAKRLEAKLIPANFIGQGIVLYRLYKF